MNPTILGKFCLQINFGSILGGSLQSFSQYMTTCNPCQCIATCIRYGEKSVFPFADDLCELVLHRCRSDKVENKKFNGKKDFKRCKCGLNIRHAMLRAHMTANSAVFNLSKSAPLVLMTVEDPKYQPIMEELCSAERYIDAEIVHRKMIAERLLNDLSSFRQFSLLKTKIKPVFIKNGKEKFGVECLKYSNKRNKSQAENFQFLGYRIARTKKLIEKDFSPLLCKWNKLNTILVTKAVKTTDNAMGNALMLCDKATVLNKSFKSMFLNRLL